MSNGTTADLLKGLFQTNKVAAGLVVAHSRTSSIAHIAASCGYQWLFVDLEHGATSLQTASEICTAALSAGIVPFVRVPENASAWIGRALDGGAVGVVVPHIESASDAQLAVAAARYPPAGERSLSGLLPQFGYRALAASEQMQQGDALTFLVGIIETEKAIAAINEIAAVPGIDALQVGTSDLSVSLGVAGELGHPLVQEAVQRTMEACRREKKIPIVGGAYRPEWLELYVGMGIRMLLAGNDLSLMVGALRQRSDFLAGILRDRA
jgi:2-keto-3-deoxy-L-rhamnonate aldolase RhmA